MDVLNAVKRSRFVFPLACVAVGAVMLLSEGAYWTSVRSLDDLGRMANARISILGLSQGILNAETGQRGYLLTDRKEYLAPYETSLRRIDDAFKVLDQHYDGQSGLEQKLAELHRLTQAKLSEVELTVKLHQAGKTQTARDLVLSDIGKEKMEDIQLIGAELLAHESSRIATGRQDVYNTLLLSRIGVAALSAIGLLAFFLYLRQAAAMMRHQLELKRAVQAERDRLEAEVSKRTTELTELAQHLQTAREDERNRLARDLHDELGALLTSAKLDAARIKSRLAGTAPEASERLGHLVESLNSGIALKRRIIEDLRPSSLSNLGLVATLDILTREFADRSGVKVHCALEPVHLAPSTELVIYRLVQEAITNITKYAGSQNVWVALGRRDGEVEVSVRDDGRGFDTTTLRISGHGLVGMRFRVEAERGVLVVASSPGKGTMIQARFPEMTDPTGPHGAAL